MTDKSKLEHVDMKSRGTNRSLPSFSSVSVPWITARAGVQYPHGAILPALARQVSIDCYSYPAHSFCRRQ